MERINVRVDQRLKHELEAEARERGVRPSDIVREALEAHVRRRTPKPSCLDIARRIGAPKAVRAVAGACAANTLAVAIPCHRVVRSNGDLSGYRWGIERKRILLEKEAAQ